MPISAIAHRLLKLRPRRGGGLSSYFAGDFSAVEAIVSDILAANGVTGRIGALAAAEIAGDVIASLGTITSPTGGLVFPNFPYDPTRSILPGSLWVSPSGSDSNNGLSSISPKQSIAAAVGALGTSSSKTIYLMDGTHTPSSSIVCIGSGNPSQKIEVTSAPGATPTIDGSAIGSSADTPIFVCDAISYWKFSHFNWSQWCAAFKVAENNNTPNIEWFCNSGITNRPGDNVGWIHFWEQGRAPGAVVDRLRLTFTGDATTSLNHTQNTAGIYWKRTSPVAALLDHFEIYGYPIGIYHKHGEPSPTQQGLAIARNGIVADVFRVPMGFNESGWVYRNCILHGALTYLSEADGGAAGDLNLFDHCTVLVGMWLSNQAQSGLAGAQNNTIRNSLLSRLVLESPSSVDPATSDYNLFTAASNAITRYGTNLDLPGWRSANGSDVHSVQGNPVFVGGNARAAASWALASGSPGKNAASDGTDIGANPALIGAQAA